MTNELVQPESLKEKLRKKTEGFKQEKEQAEKIARETNLDPIRARITELNEQKANINLVVSSLEEMREFPKKINEHLSSIDPLIDENKEALAAMGIENKDQFINHEEFADDAEVKNYKTWMEHRDSLPESDNSLRERLATLGVNVDPENFSYDSAKIALHEKLASVKAELLQEKLKTPEGKIETIETIANNLEEKLPKIYFEKNNEKIEVFISPPYSSSTITINGFNFNKNDIGRLIPNNIEELRPIYDDETIRAAIKEAYGNKLEKALQDFDSENGNYQSLAQQIESISPEAGDKVRITLEEFSNLQQTFRETISKKSEELKTVGINLNPIYAYSDHSGKYEDLIYPSNYEDIKNSFSRNTEFGPSSRLFDFIKIQKEIQRNKDKLQIFIDTISNLHTQSDVDDLTGENSRNELTSKLALGYNSSEDLYFKLENNDATNTYLHELRQTQRLPYATDMALLFPNIKTYKEAKAYSQNKIQILNDIKNEADQKIEPAINFKLKEMELIQKIKEEKILTSPNYSDVDRYIAKIERDKRDALDLLTQLAKLESELLQEQITLKNGRIEVVSAGQQIEQLRSDLRANENGLRQLNNEIVDHRSKAPKLFGKIAWTEKLTTMEQAHAEVKEKIAKIEEDLPGLYNKNNFRVDTSRNSFEELVKKQDIQGTPSEVFNNLRNELQKIVTHEVPQSVMKLYEEYKTLEKNFS
jgi:hypothetical protein